MNQAIQQSRRAFLSSTGKFSATCAMMGMTGGIAFAAPTSQAKPISTTRQRIDARDYLLNNVRLEEGFDYQGSVLMGTRSGLYQLRITDGKIARIQPQATSTADALPAYDAAGQLLLPTLRDMHIHLDKTFYGGPWEAPRRGKNIVEMIQIEERLIPTLLPTSQARAEQLIQLLHSKGSTVARSHCNIDPISGLKSLEHLQLALTNYRADFDCEIVAFPQHGLLRANAEPLMREAMQMGVNYVGGLDPTNVDGDMRKSLDLMFLIALDNQAGIDIHLHETSPVGLAAIDYMIELVAQNPQLRGKLTLSHAFALATLEEGSAINEMAARLAEQQISIASTIPLGKGVMPLPTLVEHGVRVMTGTDSVTDHWSPFGSGDMLEKANLYAQLYRGGDEFKLSRALKIATGGVTPLDDSGQRAWPQVGDVAGGVLVKASCSAEAVARLPAREAVFHRGRLVSGAVTPL